MTNATSLMQFKNFNQFNYRKYYAILSCFDGISPIKSIRSKEIYILSIRFYLRIHLH